MNHWDAKWMDTMNENNVERDLEDRYMDDIRVVMMCLGLDGDGRRMDFIGEKSGRSRMMHLRRQQRTGSSWTP